MCKGLYNGKAIIPIASWPSFKGLTQRHQAYARRSRKVIVLLHTTSRLDLYDGPIIEQDKLNMYDHRYQYLQEISASRVEW